MNDFITVKGWPITFLQVKISRLKWNDYVMQVFVLHGNMLAKWPKENGKNE